MQMYYDMLFHDHSCDYENRAKQLILVQERFNNWEVRIKELEPTETYEWSMRAGKFIKEYKNDIIRLDYVMECNKNLKDLNSNEIEFIYDKLIKNWSGFLCDYELDEAKILFRKRLNNHLKFKKCLTLVN